MNFFSLHNVSERETNKMPMDGVMNRKPSFPEESEERETKTKEKNGHSFPR